MNTLVFAHPVSRSFAVHLALLLLALWFVAHAPKWSETNSEPIAFELVEPKTKSAKDESKPTQTVVRPSEGDVSKVAKENSYLSDKTRVAREQISAKNAGDVNSMQTTPVINTGVTKGAEKNQNKPKVVTLSDLGLKINPIKNENYAGQRNWAEQNTGESMRGGEYIQGLKQGDVSALNTKEFVFYSYFERVRRQLDQSWQPILREQIARLYKNGRRLASDADYVTRTVVTLNDRGEVARVRLLEESGTVDLDDAAIQALNRAGPYPNPPKGLIDDSNEVNIRWDFILKT